MEQKELKKMLNELLELEDGLSNWEMEFVENLSEWDGDFTSKQAARLEIVWNKHF